MIDVNKITSTLAKLPDQQLQQYAQMHKNDPYIMALAMSESNRRKEMRASGQGGQGMQEQPKVVDQMVAEMAPPQLPEEMGIGQLPAGEMNFAGGGIIAFADGGDVERFNGSQSQFVQDIMGIPQQYTEYQERIRESDRLKAEREKEMAQRRQDELAARQKTSFFNYVFGSPEREAEGKAELAQLATTPVGAPARSGTMPESGYTRPGMLYDPRLNTPPTQPVVAAPKADTKPAGPRPAPTDTAAAPTQDKGVSGLDALVNNFTRSTELAQGALKNQRAGIASQFEQEAIGAKEEGEKRRAARGDVFAKKEERLAEREKSIAGLGDKYMGLALLQAGAAMMSTPGNLGSVIGKGIAVGSERYIAGIDKINAAKDKFAEARDRLDDLRLNRDDMNEKEVRDENRAIRNARLQGQQLLVDGATKDLEISNANQKAIFGVAADSILTDKRIEAERKNVLTREGGENVRSTDRLNATLNTPERMAFMSALEKTKTKENPQGDPAAAYQSVVAMKREPVSQEKLRADWLDPAKRMQIAQDYPNVKTFDDYALVMGAGTGGGAGGFKLVGVR